VFVCYGHAVERALAAIEVVLVDCLIDEVSLFPGAKRPVTRPRTPAPMKRLILTFATSISNPRAVPGIYYQTSEATPNIDMYVVTDCDVDQCLFRFSGHSGHPVSLLTLDASVKQE
jgi:hypothetical protein